jgi:hypothetical protein
MSISDPSPIVSDTGELAWHHLPPGTGLVTVETPRSQALVGFVKANQRELKNLAAAVQNDFCAIMLGTLDGKPIASSARMLLTTGSKVATTGIQWDEKRTTLISEGTAPVLIETVAGAITLKDLDGAGGVTAIPLNGAGKPTGNPVQAQKNSNNWTFPIGAAPTPWYLIEVSR